MNAKFSSDTRSSENNPVDAQGVNERHRLLLDLSGDGIIVVQNGVIKESNRSMAKMCGCHPESMLDSAIAEYFPFDENPDIQALAGSPGSKTKKPQTQSATLVCKTGQRLKVEIKATGCAFEKKPAILWVIRDISDRLTARKSLEKAGKLDAIAALSGGIAHDYNNLLTAIIGNITLAQTHLDAKDKPFRLLGHALVASKTAKNLTQKLITFSKGGSPNKEIAEVDRLVRSATDFTLSGSNIKCNYTFPADLHLIDVDQSQVGQAIHNVIMNAREAMHAGGSIHVAAANAVVTDEVATLMAGDYVKISVSDQGNGIPPDEFDKIFEPYYSTKKRGNARGTGLGLSICRSIIRKHGGDVTVASQMGGGTTIQLYVPAADPRASRKIPTERPREQPPIFGEGKILVMDDDPMIRDLAGEILWHLGYEAEFATDGKEAIALYRKSMKSAKPFDAVILDLTVRGGMGGKETIQKLIAIDPDVKGIVSSGYSDDPGMTDFKQFGFCGVVAKPYTLKELGEKLSQVLKS
jgi:PAS domain S-box-containing protein